MKTMNVGIVGGCMTCQADLKLSQLFFRSLSKMLLEQDGIRCFVSLRYYNEYFRIPELADHLVKYENPDIIIIQVRPAPFIMRSEFLIQDYRGNFIINPLVFPNGKLERIETILGTKDPVILHDHDFQQRKDRDFLLRILKSNIGIGNVFRLKKRAIRSVKKIIANVSRTTAEKGIPLFIIGNINAYNDMHDLHLSGMNKALKALTEKEGIPYIDLHSAFSGDLDRYFGPDRHHLNGEGHALTAEMLYRSIKVYLEKGVIPLNS